VEAALRRWGKSFTLSPMETINSSAPFQENTSLSPMGTVDSVPPLFQEVMTHTDSIVADDHPVDQIHVLISSPYFPLFFYRGVAAPGTPVIPMPPNLGRSTYISTYPY
jgi:hypothetical protein